MGERPLLIGVCACIGCPGSQGQLPGVFTRTLHYLKQSVVHWVPSGHAMAVMIPAVMQDNTALCVDRDPDDHAGALDHLVRQGGNDVAPEACGQHPLQPERAGDRVRDLCETAPIDAVARAGKPVCGVCCALQPLGVIHGGSP